MTPTTKLSKLDIETLPNYKKKTGKEWSAACPQCGGKKVLDYIQKSGIIVSAETDRNRGVLLLSAIENHNIFIVGKAPFVSGFTSRLPSQQRWQTNKGRFVMLKQCTRCRRFLDASLFHKDKTKLDGLYTICKECRSGKTGSIEVPPNYRLCRICDKVKPVSQFYKAHEGATRKTCIDCSEERWTKSYRTKPGCFPGHYKQSLLGFLDPSDQKNIYRSNPKNRKATRKADTKYKNSPRGIEKRTNWILEHRPRRVMYQQIRKARKLNLPCTFTEQDWEITLDAFEQKCAYCGRNNIKLAQDHWIPLIRGGPYIMGNIVPACKRCNSSKRDKLPQDFCRPSDYLRILNIIKGLIQ
jgi:5-methylcytosine-specific restriction endonuclease McrA